MRARAAAVVLLLGDAGASPAVAMHLIVFDGSVKAFRLCRAESLDACIGPSCRQGREA